MQQCADVRCVVWVAVDEYVQHDLRLDVSERGLASMPYVLTRCECQPEYRGGPEHGLEVQYLYLQLAVHDQVKYGSAVSTSTDSLDSQSVDELVLYDWHTACTMSGVDDEHGSIV